MTDSSSIPDRKPGPLVQPETGADANSMDRLMTRASTALKAAGDTVRASDLKPGTPYNVGHDMTLHGAGQQYGSAR